MINLKKLESETEEQYLWKVGQLVDSGQITNWASVNDIVNRELLGDDETSYRTESAWRKKYQSGKKFYEGCFSMMKPDDYIEELRLQKEEIRKERIKLQTTNIERSRLDREESRQELYYEYVGNVITHLPLPTFRPLYNSNTKEVNYVVGLADVHYGACYTSVNNEYSPAIAKQRFEYLTGKLINFIQENHLNTLTVVSLGDLIQGILRLNDLKINDSSIVKATVEVCRLIASMLNELSVYANISYYHTPSANHTQIRALGAKANQLADEDLEYLMGNYIHDLCAGNERITVHLAKDGEGFIEVKVPGNDIIAMHGHQIKNVETAIKDLSILHKKFYDTVMLGHYHNGKEIPSHEGILGDAEVLISPSFGGSDPYSDSICKGSKAAVKIYGFDKLFGHTETYKIILN